MANDNKDESKTFVYPDELFFSIRHIEDKLVEFNPADKCNEYYIIYIHMILSKNIEINYLIIANIEDSKYFIDSCEKAYNEAMQGPMFLYHKEKYQIDEEFIRIASKAQECKSIIKNSMKSLLNVMLSALRQNIFGESLSKNKEIIGKLWYALDLNINFIDKMISIRNDLFVYIKDFFDYLSVGNGYKYRYHMKNELFEFNVFIFNFSIENDYLLKIKSVLINIIDFIKNNGINEILNMEIKEYPEYYKFFLNMIKFEIDMYYACRINK